MTLKEIYKIIDEADVVMYGYYIDLHGMNANFKECEKEAYRRANDKSYPQPYPDGETNYYYKFDKETGDMKLLAIVDHIDPEKKIVRKKLDEMTKEEVEQLKVKLCTARGSCSDCPFHNKFYCYGNFPFWKDRYEECKDKEFEVEVEE